jgi:hypothetical protein
MTRLLWPLAVIALSGVTSAEIVPIPGSQSVNAVFNNADLVCNCVVRAVRIAEEAHVEREGTPLTTQHLIATVEIEDLYKPRSMNQQITVGFDKELPSTRASLPELRQGERALMFLTAASSSYVFADPFLGVIPFDELPQHPGEQGLNRLQASLVSVLQVPNREGQLRAMELLEGFDSLSPDTVPSLLSLGRSSDPEVALAAIAVLLKIKPVDKVTLEALNRLRSISDSQNAGLETTSLINVGSELRNISDPSSLPVMKALALSRFVVIRRGAMQALRALKNPDAASTVVTRLDDSDGYVRYIAVISLAETFNKNDDYAPSMDLFDRNPTFYLDLWKAWWATEGEVHQSSPRH